jgi:hypothetical protein
MSAIQPHMAPGAAGLAAGRPNLSARAAQAAFFQAALRGPAPTPVAAATQRLAQSAHAAPAKASEPAPATSERLMRPGALLDIRV